jgi:CDP-diacylglycerol--glycerol-3-phosphate 3-phosphatidyltransferase
MNLANTITVSRYPVLVITVLMLYYGPPMVQLGAVGMVIVLILMDSLDGVVARRRNEATLIGSALDIAADRAVEIVLWIVYADLGLVSPLIPIVVVIRGTLTDAIRNVALQHGYSAHRMMRSELGHWLVAGPVMRMTYGIVKLAAFVLLATALGTSGERWGDVVLCAGQVTAWAALVLCLARGLPVLVEAPRFFRLLEQEAS